MKNLFCLAALACLICLTSCNVTPMLNVPAIEKNIVKDKAGVCDKFTGTWFDAKEGRTVTISLCPVQNKDVLQISVLDKINNKKDNTNPLPLCGVPVQYGANAEQFFLLCADLDKIRKMAKTSELLGIVTRPYFYLAKAEILKDGKLEISFVNWVKKENDKDVITDPGVKLLPNSNLVINTSAELSVLIENKKYVLTNTCVLDRKK